MNTTVNNKLLAEFLEFEKVKFPESHHVFIIPDCLSHNEYKNLTLEDDKEVVAWCAENLLFHKDWNWLMKVVEKIESLPNCQIDISLDWCRIGWKGELYNYDSRNYYKQISKLEATYNTCVEFVKLYNAYMWSKLEDNTSL